MIWIANPLVALVAVLHVYFLVLQRFLWQRAAGPEHLSQRARERR